VIEELPGHRFLVKWRGQDETTVEDEPFVAERISLWEWRKLRPGSRPRRLPTRWIRPPPEDYAPLPSHPESRRGIRFTRIQKEALEWLRQCWYERRNSGFADGTALGKCGTISALFSWLGCIYGVRGPFLVLCDEDAVDFWVRELGDWTDLKTVAYAGSASNRNLAVGHGFVLRDVHGRVQSDRVGFEVVVAPFSFHFHGPGLGPRPIHHGREPDRGLLPGEQLFF
jgi:chromodomain-helicase-DNA-binding protein 7